MNLYKFGEIIRKERIKKGMTYRKLSELTGCTVRSIQYWEKGEKSVTLTNAYKVLTALGLRLEIKR